MAPSRNSNDPSQEVPIFLRKTYHMIDTCDPAIAGWSEDGETFVVKDPEKFETTIIPQFFKHSKFSSFVRQLNFYSFRKIKYADTIRIDPKLEAETANYWRFRHESFRRGRPDLLTEIKRMNNQKNEKKDEKQPPVAAQTDSVATEVAVLKKRIDEMTKNIDALTAMVAKVNLKQEEQEVAESFSFVGAKRKKAEPGLLSDVVMRPDAMTSNTEIDDFASSLPLPDPTPLSNSEPPTFPTPMAMQRETSSGGVTDADFVNELFTAFEDDDDGVLNFDSELSGSTAEDSKISSSPDPELMRRLGDALAVLPRDIQEMIVERLIKAITSIDFVDKCLHRVVKVEGVPSSSSVVEEHADEVLSTPDDYAQAAPLAAATFAALLHHYTSQVQGKSVKNMSKVLPIIPAHA